MNSSKHLNQIITSRSSKAYVDPHNSDKETNLTKDTDHGSLLWSDDHVGGRSRGGRLAIAEEGLVGDGGGGVMG